MLEEAEDTFASGRLFGEIWGHGKGSGREHIL